MKELTGFGIRFQEAGGSQLRHSFNLDLGKGKPCGRECPPSTSNGNKRENCGSRTSCTNQTASYATSIPGTKKKEDIRREGMYVGESSRSLRDTKGFSKKSNMFKNCMSRQETIRIQRTTDNLLSRKCKYLRKCITRINVNAETWKRKEEREERKKQKSKK